jgi:hypothetical protein
MYFQETASLKDKDTQEAAAAMKQVVEELQNVTHNL